MAEGKPYVVQDDADVADVLHATEDHQIRRMPVVSHDDIHLVGIITEADVARHLASGQVAELVGTVTRA